MTRGRSSDAWERRVRRLAAARRRRALILCYHRIAAPDGDPQGLAVDPARFAAHLEVLGAGGHEIVPLDALLDLARRGKAATGAVALTFDDGYANNLELALPALRAADAAATIFVASGWIGGSHEAWWDEVELLTGDDPTVYRSTLERLKGLDTHTRTGCLCQLRERAGRAASPARPGRRPLSIDELLVLARVPGVQIGGHTAGHPSLARLPGSLQRMEVLRGRAELADVLGFEPALFAYPFGARGADYDATTAAAVREAGFVAGLGTDPGPLTAQTRPFAVSRILVGDWERERFARRLRRAMVY